MRISNTILVIFIMSLFSACDSGDQLSTQPTSFQSKDVKQLRHIGEIDKKTVPSIIKRPRVMVKDNPEMRRQASQYYISDPLLPKKAKKTLINSLNTMYHERVEHTQQANRSLQSSIDAIDFNGNAANTGFFNIPADSHAAAGINHLVNTVNTSIETYSKNGTLLLSQSLATFFST